MSLGSVDGFINVFVSFSTYDVRLDGTIFVVSKIHVVSTFLLYSSLYIRSVLFPLAIERMSISLFFLSVCHAKSSLCDMLLTGGLHFFIILNTSWQMSLLYDVSVNMFDDMMVS